jgi:hypothetical protein
MTFVEFISKLPASLASLLRLSWRHTVGLWVTVGFILFAPVGWWQRIGVYALWSGYRFWLVVLFVFLSVYLLAYPLEWCFLSATTLVKGKVQGRRTLRQATKKLDNLSLDEKELLKELILEGCRTRKFLPGNGTVALLVHARVLSQTSVVGDLTEGFPFSLTDWAWNYLLKHPECVNVSKQDLDNLLRG